MSDAPPDAPAPEPPAPAPPAAGEATAKPKRGRPSTRVLTWAVVALLAAGGLAFIVKGANKPNDPTFANAQRSPVAGFGEIAYRINKTAQQSRCALLAQNDQQRGQGLMNRTDLAGY